MDQRRGNVRVEPSQKRVRTYLGGELVADTTRAMFVWEIPYYPAYYLPVDDVRADLLVPTTTITHSPSRGDAHHFTVKAGGKEAVDAAWTYPDSPLEALRRLVRIDWAAMDSWFEEDEEVFVHPRDPYRRVDALPSSRRVRVEIDGVTVAESSRPTLLFETGLPARYYLPKPDVRMDLLTPTDTATQCPYKGTARYWSARIGDTVLDDIAWSYPAPLPESIKVAGLVAFYNEKVDIWVDGELETRPTTPFS
jgi:uncharacterized protein (DUF427 family)